jgi:hypothetical protein
MWKTIGVGLLMHWQAVAQPVSDLTTRATPVEGDDGTPTLSVLLSTPTPRAAPVAGNSSAETFNVLPPTGEATIHFRDDVGRNFRLVTARFAIDAKDLPRAPTKSQHGRDYVIFQGALAAGRHTLTSHLTYRGRGRGVFTYLKGYTFNLTSEERLEVAVGGTVSVTVVGKEQKGFNVPYEKSLATTIEPTVTTYGAGVVRASAMPK